MPYRYEDLGDEGFQRLCGGLLSHLFESTQLPSLNQSDGGFDAFRRSDGGNEKLYGYQFKWTKAPARIADPVTWLFSTIKGERSKIQAMAASGTTHYLLITNIPSTARPRVGTLDRLDEHLQHFGKDMGVQFSVWWRSDLDARVDAAPAELKFSFPDMLIGSDAIRALLADSFTTATGKRHSGLVRAAALTAADEEGTIGFRQAKLDGIKIDRLFVDVAAVLAAQETQLRKRNPEPVKSPGGLELLLDPSTPRRTLFHGAPGQGKSTLIQKLCLEHRRRLLDGNAISAGSDLPKIALRVVLREYALWLKGIDPFDPDGGRRPTGTRESIEGFAAHILERDSGGQSCTIDDLVEICDRFPSVFAFDGLDEVADLGLRFRVVKEIGAFDSRSSGWRSTPQLVVTSRPSFENLPEPSADQFTGYRLDALDEPLRLEYLRNWADCQGLRGRERRQLERIFRERSGEDHIRDLATNPMQLTILLYLIHQRGHSVPENRTDLFADYLQSFLDREAANDATIKGHRLLLEEVMAHLGWLLQALAESQSGAGRMTRADLMRAMKHYLAENDRDVALVSDLFTAVTTRVWALVSRFEGTFEFDVQSIREYFAAKHIFDWASTSSPDSDVFTRFRETARRPYWLNTVRFMAGMFRSGERAQLADDLIDEIDDRRIRFWPRRLALRLVADGVFDAQPRPRRRLVAALLDDLGVRLVSRDIDSSVSPPISIGRGGQTAVQHLFSELEADVHHPIALERARLLSHYKSSSTDEWWLKCVRNATNGDRSRWFQIGRILESDAPRRNAGLRALVRSDQTEEVEAVLALGIEPERETPLDAAMLKCVLDGRSDSRTANGASLAASLAFVIDIPLIAERAALEPTRVTEWNRRAAANLRRLDPNVAEALLKVRAPAAGEKGTTLWFATLADAVHEQYGRAWLAFEVALIGAASVDLLAGHRASHDASAFGPDATPSALIRELRANAHNTDWWVSTSDLLDDELDNMVWLLAVMTCSMATWIDLVPAIGRVYDRVSPRSREVVWSALALISPNSVVHPLPTELIRQIGKIREDVASLAIARCADDEVRSPLSAQQIFRLPEGGARDCAIGQYWHLLEPGFESEPYGVEILLCARSSLMLSRIPTHHAPELLNSEKAVVGPWSIIEWLDRDYSSDSQQYEALFEVAKSKRWFVPAL